MNYFLGNKLKEPLFKLDEQIKFKEMPNLNMRNASKKALGAVSPGSKVNITFNCKDFKEEVCTLEYYNQEENEIKFVEYKDTHKIHDILRVGAIVSSMKPV